MVREKSNQNGIDGTLAPDDLRLFLLEPEPNRARNVARNLTISVVVHLFLFVVLQSLPEVVRPVRAPEIVADLRKAVTLVAPRFSELTQTDPNQGKVSRSVDVRSAVTESRPAIPRTPTNTPAPSAPAPVVAPNYVPPAPPAPEPPKIEVAANSGMPAGGNLPQFAPAPPQNREASAKQPDKPKMAFESVAGASVTSTSTNAALTPPRSSMQELTRASAQPGGGGTAVGDSIDPLAGLGVTGQAPASGRMGSNLQLLSDPLGVDFKPYLVQVLGVVRRNWMTVIPESARLGRKGLVVVQFIIDREGKVPKLVIASTSGTAAFDRAAVAGVSMSHPFPPLPVGYKGDQVRLQLAFAYNTSK